ncbi:MAG: 50S ribosomal protein L21 [Candidatus Eisenbacteria sp.]|nr:50S ribosomal protein L21 [Candidatus Eisenbacteria bacterium]
MYAIVSMQGFQYRVAEGETLRVPVLEAQAGEEITVSDVHLISDGDEVLVGRPTIPDARVTAEVLGHGRGPKLHAAKYKRRKDYRRRWGHRTNYTELRIRGIARP